MRPNDEDPFLEALHISLKRLSENPDAFGPQSISYIARQAADVVQDEIYRFRDSRPKNPSIEGQITVFDYDASGNFKHG